MPKAPHLADVVAGVTLIVLPADISDDLLSVAQALVFLAGSTAEVQRSRFPKLPGPGEAYVRHSSAAVLASEEQLLPVARFADGAEGPRLANLLAAATIAAQESAATPTSPPGPLQQAPESLLAFGGPCADQWMPLGAGAVRYEFDPGELSGEGILATVHEFGPAIPARHRYDLARFGWRDRRTGEDWTGACWVHAPEGDQLRAEIMVALSVIAWLAGYRPPRPFVSQGAWQGA